MATVRADRSWRFSHTLSRRPGQSVAEGIRMQDTGNPDPERFAEQHTSYLEALEQAGVEVLVLEALEEFPDSVFIEDAAVCIDGAAILTRPGAASRRGEAAVLRPALESVFAQVLELPGDGKLDGGDVLLTDSVAMIGLSERTDERGLAALGEVLEDFGYTAQRVDTPDDVLHFKSDCSLLDSETIVSTRRLSVTGCFEGMRILHVPDGEEAVANMIRVNDSVLLSTGFPATRELLIDAGYDVIELDSGEAAKVDGGLSCMSLRFFLPD